MASMSDDANTSRSGLEDWFAVFRAGTHVDSGGRSATFTQGDLDGIVERWRPGSSPLVIEHDALYSPFGYGQVAELRRDGDVLLARAEDVEPQFAQLVADRRLTGRSVELLPGPDGCRLGHVAFLGAAPPAVDGLEPIRLSARGLRYASATGWEEVERLRGMARLMRAVREIAQRVFGEDADDVISQWELEQASEEVGAARQRASQQSGDDMAQTYTQEQLDAAVAAAAAEQERRFAAERRTNEERRLAFARQDVEQRLSSLIDAGRLTPAQAEGAADFALALPAAPLRFSRGGGAEAETVESTPLAWFFSFLGSLPRQFDGAERAGRGSDPGGGAAGLTGEQIRDRALAYQRGEAAEGRRIDMMAAIQAVSAQGGAHGDR